MATTAEQTALKIACDARELGEAVAAAASVAPTKAPRPIIQNVLISAKDGALEVMATDLEVSLRILVERAEVLSEGRVLVPAARAMQILRELEGERLEVEADERSGCVFKTPESRFHVLGDHPEDFPEIAEFPLDAGASAKGETSITLKSADLVDMVRRTHFAAATEKTRYAINGILIDAQESRIRLVATDGKRLALAERAIVSTETGKKKSPTFFVVVPTKGLTLVQRLLAQGEETVRLRVVENELQVRTLRATIAARLVEGHFPPYEEVLPRALEKKLELPREPFQGALRRTALLTTRESSAVRFKFTREGLEMTARVPEVGESRVRFALDFPYQDLEIGFNPQFLQDALKVVEGSSFRLELKSADTAALLREHETVTSEAARGFLYVVMPINLA